MSTAVLVVATVVTGAAALGPMYARAAGESTLRDELTQAGSATGLQFIDSNGFVPSYRLSDFAAAQRRVPPPGGVFGYPVRIPSIYVITGASAPDGAPVRTALAWRPGSCRHLRIVVGHCPSRAGQALASQRTLEGGYGWKVGTRVSTGVGATVKIVGGYVPDNPGAAFWFGGTYFDAQPNFHEGPDTVDAVFVTRNEFAAVPPSTPATMSWDYPLDVASIRLADVPRLRHAVAAAFRRVAAGTRAYHSINTATGLDSVLGAAAHQRSLVNVGTLLVTLQLSLLAWLVLFQVVADAVESRGNEIALAKLRGFRPSWTARFTLGEPVLLLVFALPLGLLLAWAVAHVFSAAVLRPGTPVVLTWAAVLALLAGFAGGVLAAGVASYRALTRSVLAQWRRTVARHRRSWPALVIDVLVSLSAVTGLLILRATHRSGSGNDTAALLAPGLLVIAVALLGTRLLPLATRTLLRPTRWSGRIGMFLAARQVVRRPAGLRLAALLAVAIGLATFAVSGEAVATVNRAHRAQAELGAARVVALQYNRHVDPIAATHRADPHGRWAMAAATWLPDGGDSVVGTVLGVDSTRLAAVGYRAAGGPSTARLAKLIGRSTAPVLDLHGSRLRVRITDISIHGAAPQVQFALRTPTHPFVFASAGRLRRGTREYVAKLHCAQGCTFDGIVFNRPVSYLNTMRGTVLIRQLDRYAHGRWRQVNARLTQPSAWRPGPEISQTTDRLQATARGLRDRYRTSSGYGGVTYAYAPVPLPAVATPAGVQSDAPSPPRMVDNFQTTATFTVVGRTSVLPVVLGDGLILDVRYLRAELTEFDYEANWSIWLGPHAPPNALAKLRNAGLTLQKVSTTHARIVQLGRQAPALSLFLLLACAIVGAIAAVGGTAIAISASARRRSFEAAALRVVGVPRGALYRAGVIEHLLLLGCAVVLGVPAGAFAARLAMPVIPEFSDPTPIALTFAPPWPPLLGFAVGFALLVVLTATVAARAVISAARPARLREAEE